MLGGVLRELDPEGIPMPLLQGGVTDGRFFSQLGIQTYGFMPMRLPADFRSSDRPRCRRARPRDARVREAVSARCSGLPEKTTRRRWRKLGASPGRGRRLLHDARVELERRFPL